jgi:hypothetical protein
VALALPATVILLFYELTGEPVASANRPRKECFGAGLPSDARGETLAWPGGTNARSHPRWGLGH